jgi:hypothetical protein
VTPDVPPHLIRLWNPVAGADGASTDWQRAVRTANERAAFDASEEEREQIRRFGLVRGRKPAALGEHHVDDRLGREVLRELARRQRGES